MRWFRTSRLRSRIVACVSLLLGYGNSVADEVTEMGTLVAIIAGSCPVPAAFPHACSSIRRLRCESAFLPEQQLRSPRSFLSSHCWRITVDPSILGIHLTQVGSIPCGWAASESLRRSPGSAPLGPWGASAVSGGEIDAKRALCSCVALASQWRLLIARPKRPLFSPVSGAHHHMLGLPESDGYPVPSITS
jgi:hypothetical protein